MTKNCKNTELDIAKNRAASKYDNSELLSRVLWMFGKYIFRLSFRTMFRSRRVILRLFGAKVGKQVNIYNSTKIYMPWNLEIGDWSSIGENALIYNIGKVTIGNKSTISHGAHICSGSHDYTKVDLPLQRLPVVIGSQVWICADSFIGPGVTVANGSIVGARGVVTKDVEEWIIVAGNPAKYIGKRVIDGV